MSRVVFRGHMRPLRFPRSMSEAFPTERAGCIEHYLSTKLRHRAMRLARRAVAWVRGWV